MFRGRAQRIHFVGLGGIGMSGIAEVLLTLGYDVRGSDLHLSAITARLEHLGATVFEGHAAAHVQGADVVVVSSAVHSQNPEVLEARRLGTPVIRRAEMLAELMRLKYGIAVAGSHGKTTTTSLIGTVLAEAGMDPTVVVGGRLKAMDSNARLGAGEYLVAEADESDGSFLRLIPTIAIVTNIDPEHLDHWRGGLPELVDGFTAFVERVPFYGAAVLCVDHPTVRELLPRLDKRLITYGLAQPADYSADQIRVGQGIVQFRALRRGEVVGDVQLNMIGRHNVLNALATLAVADEVGVPFDAYARALKAFAGIGRRFELKGEANGVRVVDDYGHHPAEIQATLQAAREAYARRLVVAFQPHRYTRTRDLLAEFGAAFDACDVLLVADIYAAGEPPLEGVHARALAEAVRQHGHKDVRYIGSRDEVATALRGIVQPGDLVLTLGAGNLWQAGEELLVYLREAEPFDSPSARSGRAVLVPEAKAVSGSGGRLADADADAKAGGGS